MVDESITDWIKEKLNKNVKPTNGDELTAYFGSSENSFGSNFSTIDNKDTKPFISSYTFLNDTTQSLADVKQSNSTTTQSNGGFDNQFEKLQQARNTEFQPLQRR